MDKNQQWTQPTCVVRTQATALGGECSYHYAIPTPQVTVSIKLENKYIVWYFFFSKKLNLKFTEWFAYLYCAETHTHDKRTCKLQWLPILALFTNNIYYGL